MCVFVQNKFIVHLTLVKAIWVYLMREKGEVASLVQNFLAMLKNQFEKNVKILRSDNGLEFESDPMLNFYSAKGIIYLTSCVDTPQQNRR